MQSSRKTFFFIFITLLFVLTSKQANSQTILLDKSEIYVGGSGGATGSMVFFNPIVSQSFIMGYNGGIVMRYSTEKNTGLQLEVNYSQRGWSELDKTYSRQMNYLEVPFLSHFYLGNKNRVILNLGPKLSYLLDEKALINTQNSNADQRVLPANSKFDYGISAGLGYNLKLPRAGVYQFEVRAYYGLADIMPNEQSDYFNNSNHINVALNIGYLFQAKGKVSKEKLKNDRELVKLEKLNKKEEIKREKEEKKRLAKEKKVVAKAKKAKRSTNSIIKEQREVEKIEEVQEVETNETDDLD